VIAGRINNNASSLAEHLVFGMFLEGRRGINPEDFSSVELRKAAREVQAFRDGKDTSTKQLNSLLSLLLFVEPEEKEKITDALIRSVSTRARAKKVEAIGFEFNMRQAVDFHKLTVLGGLCGFDSATLKSLYPITATPDEIAELGRRLHLRKEVYRRDIYSLFDTKEGCQNSDTLPTADQSGEPITSTQGETSE